MPLRILLAEDHLIVRQGVKQLLTREGYRVVAEAGDGREAVRLAREHCPDIAVLDLGMPLLNGVDAARQILKVSPNTKPILLTFKKEAPYVLEAFRAGAKGYVLKTHGASELFEAIRKVSCGTAYISPDLAEIVPQILNTDSAEDPLTPREREVLQLIAEGQTTKEVATILGVSFNTTESHRNRIMKKWNVHETAGLVRYAIRRGLTSAGGPLWSAPSVSPVIPLAGRSGEKRCGCISLSPGRTAGSRARTGSFYQWTTWHRLVQSRFPCSMSCTLHPTRYCVLSSVRVRVKTGWLYTGRTRNLTLFGISTEAASVNSMVPGSNRLTPLYDTSTIFPMIRRSAQLTRQGVRSLRRGYKRLNRCSSAIAGTSTHR